jgi:hypothetical protein
VSKEIARLSLLKLCRYAHARTGWANPNSFRQTQYLLDEISILPSSRQTFINGLGLLIEALRSIAGRRLCWAS